MQENLQATAQQIFDMTEKLIRLLYETIQSKTNIKEQQERLMKKFVQGSGPVVGSAVKPQKAEDLREELIAHNIPFMEVPGQQNGTLFLVRKENEQNFIDIQQALAAKDTALSKELTFEDGLRALKMLGAKNVPVLTFKDIQMAEIAKQKIFQSGQTFISNTDSSGRTQVILFPTAVFNEHGQDLEFFKLTHALTQARADETLSPKDETGEPALISLRKKQAQYDKQQVLKFISEAKKGKHVVLGDIRGNGNMYIEAKSSEITVRYKNKEEVSISYSPDDDLNTIAATLSRYTEDIYNMSVFKGSFYNEFMKDTAIRKEDLPKENREDLRPDITDKNPDGTPVYDKQTASINRCLSNSAQHMIISINEEATNRCLKIPGFNLMSAVQKAALKHKEIITILNDPDFSPIADFLNEDRFGTNKETREKILDIILDNFTNEQQNTRYSADISQEFVNNLNISQEAEPEYTNEREEL